MSKQTIDGTGLLVLLLFLFALVGLGGALFADCIRAVMCK